jgi:E2/UBC family protein E
VRREVVLPDEDVRALDALGLPWETAVTGGANWLFLHQFPVPDGYTTPTAILGVRLAAYPRGVLDMVYFDPPLARRDGNPIAGLSSLAVDGRTFQQWSRHYAWTPGIDTLTRHVRRAGAWLRREFNKR